MSDLIDRQRAIEAVKLGITYAKLIDTETGELLEPFKASNDELKRAVQRIKNLPSAQPYTIHSDGRLWVTVDDIDKVTAVVVDEHKSKFCKQFYEDEQPKMGRWIHHPEIGWGETWLCDQCGEKTTSTVMGKPRANFCPNCGADMRGEQDG